MARDPGDPAVLTLPALPDGVARVLAALVEAGEEAALVGGTVRDALAGRPAGDNWDIATSAPPERVAAIFPGATWENRFGTVSLPGERPIEITTYRSEGGYSDHRRPDEVRFGVSLAEDLARRDFTVNAIAWVPIDLAARRGRLVDPHGGQADLEAAVLRAVGNPRQRFGEDALRLLRAARQAAQLGLRIDPPTAAAVRELAPSVASVSGERQRDELLRMLRSGDPPPSTALRLLEELGLLAVLLPEVAALRGVPQDKPIGGDALDHTLRTVDELPPDDPVLRLVGLVHDIGKATTLRGGHFIGHEVVGADMAGRIGRRLRLGGESVERIRHLVRQHMFGYRGWTDAAVRRFIRRVGPDRLDDLFALRLADNAASGVAEPASGGLDELRARVRRELAASPLTERQLAVDGHVLQRELGIGPGPAIGRLLERLMDAVLEDPGRNERATLLEMARHALPSLEADADRSR